MVGKAEDYRWSSYRSKIGVESSPILDPDPCYLRFSRPEEEYRVFVEQGISVDEDFFIRERLHRNGLTGHGGFVDEVERRTGLRVESRAPGRPGKGEK